ncbi:MAG: hypothetical protein IH944_03960 [Armatimonadetes bacterium]|nr:hypothetical protein [Armatimonadota bacterium]
MKSKVKILLPMIALLLAAQAILQQAVVYPYWKENYAVQSEGDYSQLAPDQLIMAAAGFREMIAGILWVRADGYFETGKYDAVLPMIRIVTLLDPKQIDVYSTGMWHIAYNFTDEAQRSDRRYVSVALALGQEGSRNNEYSYELFFETGWLWYHKINDGYDEAVLLIEKASTYDRDKLEKQYLDSGMSPAEAHFHAEVNGIPPARSNLLGKAYLRAGRIKDALYYLRRRVLDEEAKMKGDIYSDHRVARDTNENNFDNLLVRMAQRGWFAREGGYYEGGGYDTDPPFDVGFSAQVTVTDHKVLQVRGTWNVLPVGTRIRFILRDADYPHATPGGMVWNQGEKVEFEPSRDRTFLQDSLYVKNQRFTKRIDMRRDVTMYPLTRDEYVLEFYYNPRSAPDHIQDRFGFTGEGMTDQLYLNTQVREDQRVIFCQMRLTREQIYRIGEWSLGRKTPVVQTPNFREEGMLNRSADIIQVPGLRAPSASRSEDDSDEPDTPE